MSKSIGQIEREIEDLRRVRIACEKFVRAIADESLESIGKFEDTFATGYNAGTNDIKRQAKRLLESIE